MIMRVQEMNIKYPDINRSFFETIKFYLNKAICHIFGHSFYICEFFIECDRCTGRINFSDIERIDEERK